MSEKIVCRLQLTVTGRLVDGELCWQEDIWTEGFRRLMRPGTDVRDYEPELCRAGADALVEYEAQLARERLGREKGEPR